MQPSVLRSTLLSYAAPLSLFCILLSYTLHRTELPCTQLSFTTFFFWAPPVPSELHCTLWAMRTPLSCACILLSYTHSTELHCTLLSYDEACWATLFWTTLHLLSYAAPYWATQYLLSCAAPHWAKVHPAVLHSTLSERRCTLLSDAVPY